jgi:hypothetical protein
MAFSKWTSVEHRDAVLRAKRSQGDLSDDGWSSSRLLLIEWGTLVPPFVLLFTGHRHCFGCFRKKRIQRVSRTAITATKCDRATTSKTKSPARFRSSLKVTA